MPADLSLLRLMQLISPGLPIGIYSYSQGLERAIEDGWITNSAETEEWLCGLLQNNMCRLDAPYLARLYDAWQLTDYKAVDYWTAQLYASRETSELRAEDRQTGQALARLLIKLNIPDAENWLRRSDATLATLFSLAAVHWQIAKHETLAGYLWGWLENQVLCAVKLIPLGQVAGQQLLLRMAERLPTTLELSLSLTDQELGGSAFGLALASSRHEVQYSRLFRS